jgi:hypothetical protein
MPDATSEAMLTVHYGPKKGQKGREGLCGYSCRRARCFIKKPPPTLSFIDPTFARSETNPLLSLSHHEIKSGTLAGKSIPVLERVQAVEPLV